MIPTRFYTERKALFVKIPKKMAQWFPTGPSLCVQPEPPRLFAVTKEAQQKLEHVDEVEIQR